MGLGLEAFMFGMYGSDKFVYQVFYLFDFDGF